MLLNILQICKKSPTPQKDGESIAIHQMTTIFQSFASHLECLAMLTPKHPKKEESQELKDVYYTYHSIDTTFSQLDLVLSLFNKKTPLIVKRFAQKSFENVLILKLKERNWDIICLEGVFLGVYLDVIRRYSSAKLILRAHNVESAIWQRQAKQSKNFFKRFYLKTIMNPAFVRFEQQISRKVDGIIPISPIDSHFFEVNSDKSRFIIPVLAKEVAFQPFPSQFKIGFLGGMDWIPNRDGIEWFLKEIWKPLVALDQDIHFYLAGRNFPDEIWNWKYENFHPLGEIDDAQQFIQDNVLMIAPILSGSGMRVKIIEALQFGRPVLSTKVGAEGILNSSENGLYILDEKEQWIDQILVLKKDVESWSRIGQNAKAFVDENYNPKNYIPSFKNWLKKI